MGTPGYREKWIKGKLHLLCTKCLNHKLEEEFYFASYVTWKGKKSRRSECIECYSLHNNKNKSHEIQQ